MAVFPNTGSVLGVTALSPRTSNFPSTKFIVEGVGICLKASNCQFNGLNFVRKHGVVIGPKSACSYADLPMRLIVKKAKFERPVKPMLWDDIF